jgi:hypothetical protein
MLCGFVFEKVVHAGPDDAWDLEAVVRGPLTVKSYANVACVWCFGWLIKEQLTKRRTVTGMKGSLRLGHLKGNPTSLNSMSELHTAER